MLPKHCYTCRSEKALHSNKHVHVILQRISCLNTSGTDLSTGLGRRLLGPIVEGAILIVIFLV